MLKLKEMGEKLKHSAMPIVSADLVNDTVEGDWHQLTLNDTVLQASFILKLEAEECPEEVIMAHLNAPRSQEPGITHATIFGIDVTMLDVSEVNRCNDADASILDAAGKSGIPELRELGRLAVS